MGGGAEVNTTTPESHNKELSEGAKRRFDGLAVLEAQQWKEFDNKVRHEWRLSFAIWTSLVASIGAILGGKVKFGQLQPLFGVTPVAAAVAVTFFIVCLHGWFLWWIQSSLQRVRKSLRDFRNEMNGMVDELPTPQPFTRRIYTQPSIYVQALISFLLCGVFIWIVSVAP
jgi:hypothetical protein